MYAYVYMYVHVRVFVCVCVCVCIVWEDMIEGYDCIGLFFSWCTFYYAVVFFVQAVTRSTEVQLPGAD